MNKEAYDSLVSAGLRPSMQRLAILDYLLKHRTHPTIDDVFSGLVSQVPTLSRTTVYNTLRLLSGHHVAQMITIDDHHVCYDGDTRPHVHFLCRKCGKVYDLFDVPAPTLSGKLNVDGHVVDEAQLYYKGICKDCAAKMKKKLDD